MLFLSPHHYFLAAQTMNKEVTNEKILETLLAFKSEVTQKFKQVDANFKKHDKKFARIERQFTRLEGQFTSIDEKFKLVDQRFELIEKRFEVNDQKFEKVYVLIDMLTGHVVHMRDDLAALSSTTDRIWEKLEQQEKTPAIHANNFRELGMNY